MSENVALSRRKMIKGAGALALGAAAGLAPISKAVAAKGKAPRWAFIVDLRRCTGCRSCTVACKSEMNTPLGFLPGCRLRGGYREIPQGRETLFAHGCATTVKETRRMRFRPASRIVPSIPRTGDSSSPPMARRSATAAAQPTSDPMAWSYLRTNCAPAAASASMPALTAPETWDKLLISGKDSTKNGIVKCTFCQHQGRQGGSPGLC